MTRKDYILLANALQESRPKSDSSTEHIQWKLDVRAIAHALRSENYRFDSERFLNACGFYEHLEDDNLDNAPTTRCSISENLE